MKKYIVASIFFIVTILLLTPVYLNYDKENSNIKSRVSNLEQKVAKIENQKVLGTAVPETKIDEPKIKKSVSIDLPPVDETIIPSSSPLALLKTKKNNSGVTNTTVPTPTPQPSPSPVFSATVEIESVGTYSVELQGNDTAYDILVRAGNVNNFSTGSQYYDGLGYFVNCIAGICGHDNYFWSFYYNGAPSMVGASSQIILPNDITAWKFETF